MRKRKLFRRVSAWLLVWTMVLCTCGGGITTRAEEPEEVEVQIEAQSDGEIEAQNDAQIEADTEGETEIDAEIEAETEGETGVDAEIVAETGNEPADDQNGEEQGEQTDLPTGLVAYEGIATDEDGKIIGKAEGAEPKKELNLDLNGATLYMAYRNADKTETPVKYPTGPWQTDRNWLRVKDGPNGGCEFKTLGEEAGCRLDFYKPGTYKIYITYLQGYGEEASYEIKDEDNSDYYITVKVDYPLIGFYEDDRNDGEKYIKEEYEYTKIYGPTTFYMDVHEKEDEKVSLDAPGCGIFLDGGDLSEEKWDTMCERGKGDARHAYEITIPIESQEKFTLKVRAKVKKTNEEEEYKEVSLDVVYREGINAIRPKAWDDANGPSEFDSTYRKKDAMKYVTIDLGGGHEQAKHLYFSEYKANNNSDGAGNRVQDVDLYYLNDKDDGTVEPIEVNSENQEVYGTIRNCKESGCEGKYIFSLNLKKEGTYQVEKAKWLGNVEGYVIIKTQCPEYGFYTGNQVSDEKLLWDDADCRYGSEENGDFDRTLYFLKRDGAEGTITDVRVIWKGKDKTKEFITQKESQNGNGLEITVDPDCRLDFDLQVDIEKEGGELEQKSIKLCYAGLKASDETQDYDDGQPEKAFSGCMLTAWGYKMGTPEDIDCTPDKRYWVHGNTAQEVLEKLTKPVSVKVTGKDGEETTVTIEPTGYYYITMSCYTGDTDAEVKQEADQTVTLPEGVKGVVMDSGFEPEVAWENDKAPDFEEGTPPLVYAGFGSDGETKACYLESEENGTESGWYEVTKSNKGIYVYDLEKPVKDSEGNPIPKPDSDEWKADEEDLSAKYQTVDKYFNWPNLVLDATTGYLPVKLEGQWEENKGVSVKYNCGVNFSMEVCGKEITQKNADPKTPYEVKEGSDTITTVSFDRRAHSTDTEVRDKKDSTCKEEGYTGDTYCKVCDEVIEGGAGTVIPKTEHKWDAGKVTKEATETEKGVRTYTCQNGCGQTKTEEIPLLEKKPDPKPEQPQQPQPQPKGTKIADAAGNTYKVTSDPQAKEPTVEYTAPGKDAKGTVKVPDSVTIDGVDYKVTAIADNAFKGNKKVTKVTVGKNVIFIGKNAFSGCTKLKNVTIGASVMEIGATAFKGCAALTKITLPAKVQKIGKNAFAGCKKLKTIIIKSTKLTAKSVSKGAFKGVTTKTTIKVPKSKLKAYKKLFQSKGLSKKVKVKA